MLIFIFIEQHMHKHSENAEAENIFRCCWRKCVYREYGSCAELKEHVEKSHLSRMPLHCPLEGCKDTFKHHHMLSPHFLEEHPVESQNILSFGRNSQSHKSSLPQPPPPPTNLPPIPPAPIPVYLLDPLSVTCCQWSDIVIEVKHEPAFDWLVWLDADPDVKGQLWTGGVSGSGSTSRPAGELNPQPICVRRSFVEDPEDQLSSPCRRPAKRARDLPSTIGFYKFPERVGVKKVTSTGRPSAEKYAILVDGQKTIDDSIHEVIATSSRKDF